MLENRTLSEVEKEYIFDILKERFHTNKSRRISIDYNYEWDIIRNRLLEKPEKLWSLHQMEITGGEPDVVDHDLITDSYIFCDCSIETPIGRRSLCYDLKALNSRKSNKPQNDAVSMAEEMGIELLDEEQYRQLQKLFRFDLKTSSWVRTPENIRALGGAIFCDNRYDTVFVYHNGAESYYSSRGFRGRLLI